MTTNIMTVFYQLRDVRMRILTCDINTPEGRALLETLRKQSNELYHQLRARLEAIQQNERVAG
ncbi:MAG: hypothetical protein K8L97_25165 [Anaerolineae bacterium]|nr:hypothetical protein [Anaerolineae bacterium]